MTTAVAKAKETAVSTEVMDDIFEFAGEGASFSSDEMQIPFVRLLQALSPQLNKKKAEYIEGASAGDAFNNVTNQYWDGETGIKVIPCFNTTKYLEFVPRDMGGGFKGEIPANSPLLQQTTRSGSKEILPSGNELVKSVQYFCFIVEDDGSYQPCCDRHEVHAAEGGQALEHADRHAEDQAPGDGNAQLCSDLRNHVASVLCRGVQ
jgi:hypothetical protein